MPETEDDPFLEKRRQVGVALLWLGGLMAILVVIDRSGLSIIDFPSFWYRSRSLHLLVCAGLCAAGVLLYRRPDSASAPEEPVRRASVHSQPLFQSVRFYSRADCPLCDEAMSVLEEYGDVMPEIEFIDIAGNEALEELHGNWIPVVEMDGRVRFRGKIDRTLLNRLISAKSRGQGEPGEEASA